uniref:G-protein coupled receptors family 1 profile domain-containing protein n=1 Tax=Meloidogyne incognita TaxID=6306 RepID=A0A914MR33_MELIC
MVGNLWVILSVLRILHKTRSPVNYTFRHMAMYILSLSIADIAVLCMVPMLLSYFLDGHWRFGLIGCKIFFTVENINKLLSVAILTIMSFERFLAVSRPFYWLCCRIRRKRVSNALGVVLVLLFFSVLLCSPMIYYADLKPLELLYDDGSVESSTQTLCGSDLPDHGEFML